MSSRRTEDAEAALADQIVDAAVRLAHCGNAHAARGEVAGGRFNAILDETLDLASRLITLRSTSSRAAFESPAVGSFPIQQIHQHLTTAPSTSSASASAGLTLPVGAIPSGVTEGASALVGPSSNLSTQPVATQASIVHLIQREKEALLSHDAETSHYARQIPTQAIERVSQEHVTAPPESRVIARNPPRIHVGTVVDKPVYRGQLPITRDIYRKAGPVESAAVSTVKWRSILEDKITVLPSATREVLNRTGHFYKQYQSTSVRSNTAGGCPLSRQERDIVINQANMILAEKFQGLALTEAQVETVVKLVQGESVLHVEAVGTTTFHTYVLPAVLQNKACIICAPTRTSRDEHGRKLAEIGYPVITLDADDARDNAQTLAENMRRFESGIGLRFLISTPERFMTFNGLTESLARMARKDDISLIAIEEACLVNMWGRAFRPAFMNFVKLIQLFPTIPVAAMTSILHHSSRKSFIELMHRPRMTVTVGEVDQPNLFYSAFFFEEIKHAEYAVAQLLIKHLDNGKVVLYATLKKDVDKYYEMVMKLVEKQRRRGGNTMVVRRYHAGLNAREQEESIKLWNTGAVDVICATSAFAFAFTRKDVALILHTSLPLNVESFLLANSYAGSVEHRAEVVTLFGLTDVATNSRILYRASCDVPHAIDQQYSLVELLTLLVNGDSCRRQQLSDFVLGPSDHPVQQMTFGTLTCCDVCAKATGEKDVTAHFHALAALVNDAAGKPEGLLTAKQVVDAYRGDKRDASVDARAKKYKWKNAGVGKGQGRAGFSQLTLIKMIANKTIASCLHPGVFQSARNLANDKDMPDGVLQESHQLFVRTYMRLVEMPSADSKFILRGPQILAVPPRLARDEVEDQLKRAARESTDTSWAPAKKRK